MPGSARSNTPSPPASQTDADTSLAGYSHSGRRLSWPMGNADDSAIGAPDVATDDAPPAMGVSDTVGGESFESFEEQSPSGPRPTRTPPSSPPLPLDGDDPRQWAAQWPQMAPYVAPFESDRRDYGNADKYPGGCTIELHPRLVTRMLDVCAGSTKRVANNLARGLGLEIVPPSDDGGGWSRGSTSPVLTHSPSTAGAAGDRSGDADDDEAPVFVRLATAPYPGGLSAHTSASTAASSAGPPSVSSSRPGTAAFRGNRSGRGSPHPAGVLVRPGSALRDPTVPTAASLPPSGARALRGAAELDTQSQTTSASAPPRVLFEDEGSPIDRIRELEAEVRELSRMLRVVQHDRQRGSQTNSPTNQHIVSNCRPSTVPAGIPTTVRVTVSGLEPDFAPFSIKVGRSIVPCIVTDRRVLSFVTPMLPPGSTPLQVMCTTAQGSVRRYGRAVWIESKPLRGSAIGSLTAQTMAAAAAAGDTAAFVEPRLTRHAVNQLAPEVPLPSGSTLRDPSETGRTSVVDSTVGKSEYDDNTTDTESNAGLGEARVPLTREMLDMFSGRITRHVGSDTASEAVASTVLTLPRQPGDHAPNVADDDDEDHRTVGEATVGEAGDDAPRSPA